MVPSIVVAHIELPGHMTIYALGAFIVPLVMVMVSIIIFGGMALETEFVSIKFYL